MLVGLGVTVRYPGGKPYRLLAHWFFDGKIRETRSSGGREVIIGSGIMRGVYNLISTILGKSSILAIR